MILECTLETELLIDLLIDDTRSQLFFKLARDMALAMQSPALQPNNRATEYFGLDGALINRMRPELELFLGLMIHPMMDPYSPTMSRAELRQIEQEILQGIEELEGMLR